MWVWVVFSTASRRGEIIRRNLGEKRRVSKLVDPPLCSPSSSWCSRLLRTIRLNFGASLKGASDVMADAYANVIDAAKDILDKDDYVELLAELIKENAARSFTDKLKYAELKCLVAR